MFVIWVFVGEKVNAYMYMNHTTSFGMPLSLKASTQVKYNVSNWFYSIKIDPTLEGSNETVIIFCFLLRLVDLFFLSYFVRLK